MLAPTPPPRMITVSQSRPLRESLLLGLGMIGLMIVGAVLLYLVTEGLLWLEGYFAIISWTEARSAAKLLTRVSSRIFSPSLQGLSSSDKPIGVRNRWWCLRSIFFRHFRAKLIADVLLGRWWRPDATRTSDASTSLMVGRSSALSHYNVRVEIAVPNNSRTDKLCRCNQQGSLVDDQRPSCSARMRQGGLQWTLVSSPTCCAGVEHGQTQTQTQKPTASQIHLASCGRASLGCGKAQRGRLRKFPQPLWHRRRGEGDGGDDG